MTVPSALSHPFVALSNLLGLGFALWAALCREAIVAYAVLGSELCIRSAASELREAAAPAGRVLNNSQEEHACSACLEDSWKAAFSSHLANVPATVSLETRALMQS